MMHVAVLRIGWTQSLWRFIKSCGSDGRSRMDAVSVAWCVALAGGRARLQRRRSDQSAAPAASTSPTDTRHMPHASRLSLPVLTVSNKPVPETSHTSYTPVAAPHSADHTRDRPCSSGQWQWPSATRWVCTRCTSSAAATGQPATPQAQPGT